MKNPSDSSVFVSLAILFGTGAVLGGLAAYWSFQAKQPFMGAFCIVICLMAAAVASRLIGRFRAAHDAEEPIFEGSDSPKLESAPRLNKPVE